MTFYKLANIIIIVYVLFLLLDVRNFERTESIPDDFICDFGSMDLPGKEVPHYNPLRNDFEIVCLITNSRWLFITSRLLVGT